MNLPAVSANSVAKNTQNGLPGETTCLTCSASSPRMSTRVWEESREDPQVSLRKRRRREDDDEYCQRVKRKKVDPKRGKKRGRGEVDDDDDGRMVKRRRLDLKRGKKRARVDVEDDNDWHSGVKDAHPGVKKRKCSCVKEGIPPVGVAFAGVGFDNSAFHLMWRNITIRLNQELLSQQNGSYGLQAAIFQSLNYQNDYRKSRAILSGQVLACFTLIFVILMRFCMICAFCAKFVKMCKCNMCAILVFCAVTKMRTTPARCRVWILAGSSKCDAKSLLFSQYLRVLHKLCINEYVAICRTRSELTALSAWYAGRINIIHGLFMQGD